jgi:aryl-alcohol dehydrogenase
MAARALGVSTIVVVDPVLGRRRLAAELGATVVLDPQLDDVVVAVRDHTGGGATSAIETTAIGDVLLQALDCLGARGTCVALGVGTPELRLGMERLSRGRSLRTTIEGDSDPHEFIPRLLQLHARGELPVDRLITTYPFAEFGRAMGDAESGATIKPVLVH